MQNTEKQIISRKRVADHGEVMTSRREVDAMLDLVKQETERIESRFLEPACGTGNFLIAILERKLAVIEKKLAQLEKRLKKAEKRPGWQAPFYEPDSLLALSSIYGIDILQDSIEAAKTRLLAYYLESYQRIVGLEPPQQLIASVRFILDRGEVPDGVKALPAANMKAVFNRPFVFFVYYPDKNVIPVIGQFTGEY